VVQAVDHEDHVAFGLGVGRGGDQHLQFTRARAESRANGVREVRRLIDDFGDEICEECVRGYSSLYLLVSRLEIAVVPRNERTPLREHVSGLGE
jgi:hypothetical protein